MQAQFFLAYLLAVIADWSCFRLVVGRVSLTISLVFSGAELMSRKIAIDFSKYFL